MGCGAVSRTRGSTRAARQGSSSSSAHSFAYRFACLVSTNHTVFHPGPPLSPSPLPNLCVGRRRHHRLVELPRYVCYVLRHSYLIQLLLPLLPLLSSFVLSFHLALALALSSLLLLSLPLVCRSNAWPASAPHRAHVSVIWRRRLTYTNSGKLVAPHPRLERVLTTPQSLYPTPS